MTVMPHHLSQWSHGHHVTLKDSQSDKNAFFGYKASNMSQKVLALGAGLTKRQKECFLWVQGIEKEYQELDTVWFMAGSLFRNYPYDIPTEAFSLQLFTQAFATVQASIVHLQDVTLSKRFALVPLGPPLLSYSSTSKVQGSNPPFCFFCDGFFCVFVLTILWWVGFVTKHLGISMLGLTVRCCQ